MIITLNQGEIEKMILRGLADMGIPHDGASVTMTAGRSPNGMTAEVKLVPVEVVVSLSVETFGSESKVPEVEITKEEYGGNNPNGVDSMKAETAEKGDDGDGAMSGKEPLFGKKRDAKTA